MFGSALSVLWSRKEESAHDNIISRGMVLIFTKDVDMIVESKKRRRRKHSKT